MFSSTVLAVFALALAAPSSAPRASSTPPPAVEQGVQETYRALSREWRAAVVEHCRLQREAERRDRKGEIEHPAVRFYPRYEELGRRGSGFALLWTLRESSRLGLSPAELTRRKNAIVGSLLEQHARAPWLDVRCQLMHQ